MGCILYELAVGTKAFYDDFALLRHTYTGKEFDINLETSFGERYREDICRNITVMLQLDPSARPSASELVNQFYLYCQPQLAQYSTNDNIKMEKDEAVDLSVRVLESDTKISDEDLECRRINEIIKAWKDSDIDLLSESVKLRNSRMYTAAREGDIYTIKALTEVGADVTMQANDGCTCMHSAASNGHVYAIKALKEAGADVSTPNNEGQTPVHYAAQNGHVDAIKALKEAGADVLVRTEKGSTPMHYAASNGHVDAIKALKEAGGDVSTPNKEGHTLMHYAALVGHVDAIKTLKEAGADVWMRHQNRRTPLDLARKHGHADAIKVLRNRPSQTSTFWQRLGLGKRQ